ncbi:PAP2-domain-containing protein [Fomitiporia mediterranea MF3/22]|uniref:PAP2-domain-containing protein n=1 Tax=Fomitiporia mediterranea (strain MF3/22) TaxID=694068 RepID=UPI0004409A89|nr:PAP2-domain-containing protein [Fomitiporia mediterranea MF3/22]EJD02401.1 PAP2-domain-containing protein [Fomitiporia mediterranea MF3/22]
MSSPPSFHYNDHPSPPKIIRTLEGATTNIERSNLNDNDDDMAWFTIRSNQGFAPPPRSKMSRKRRLALLRSYLPDWILCIVLAAVFFSLDKVPGFRREFSIEDPTLRFPFAVHERVPPIALYFIAIVAPFVIQIIVNVITIRSLWDFHNGTLGLLLGLTLTGAITQFTKITVGRPRPDVISRCQPPSGIVNPEYGLVSSAICTQTDVGILRDGWRSFPSGHSSLSFAGLGFLSFYLAGKLHLFDENGHTTKAWISLTPLSGAALVAISRTMDYRHHWQDVLVGSILGLVMSFFAYRQYYPPLGSPRAHKPFSPRIKRERTADENESTPSDESNAPILPTLRPGFSGGSLRGSKDNIGGGTGAGVGRNSEEVLTHPAVPHMHIMHGEHMRGPSDSYTQYGMYRDDEGVEDLQQQQQRANLPNPGGLDEQGKGRHMRDVSDDVEMGGVGMR